MGWGGITLLGPLLSLDYSTISQPNLSVKLLLESQRAVLQLRSQKLLRDCSVSKVICNRIRRSR